MLAARSVFCQSVQAQLVADTTTAASSLDSTAIALRDSLAVKDTLTKKSSGIDSVVTYAAADSLVYMYHDRTMDMFGKSNVKYKTMGLDGGRSLCADPL